MKNKKGEVPGWLVALLVAVAAAVFILILYILWQSKALEGVGFIKSLFGEL